MKIDDLFGEILDEEKPAKKQLVIDAVDFQKETFYLCNRPYRFAKYNENANITEGQTHLCFVTDEGYFAGFNDDDETTYFCIEVLENGEGIGFVEGEIPTGIYGSFYEDHDFSRDTKIDILPFEHIEKDQSLVWILDDDDEDGAMGRVVDVQVTANTPQDIRVKIINESNENILGCAVIQGLSLVGFVTEYDAENGEYKCISAELMAIDLCRKIYEYKVRQAMHEREIYNKKIHL